MKSYRENFYNLDSNTPNTDSEISYLLKVLVFLEDVRLEYQPKVKEYNGMFAINQFFYRINNLLLNSNPDPNIINNNIEGVNESFKKYISGGKNNTFKNYCTGANTKDNVVDEDTNQLCQNQMLDMISKLSKGPDGNGYDYDKLKAQMALQSRNDIINKLDYHTRVFYTSLHNWPEQRDGKYKNFLTEMKNIKNSEECTTKCEVASNANILCHYWPGANPLNPRCKNLCINLCTDNINVNHSINDNEDKENEEDKEDVEDNNNVNEVVSVDEIEDIDAPIVIEDTEKIVEKEKRNKTGGILHSVFWFAAIYFSFVQNDGFDIGGFLAACCCPQIYIIYFLATGGYGKLKKNFK